VSRAIDEHKLTATVSEVLHHWPVAGLAVGVVQDGSLAWFHPHGLADLSSGTRVDADTVFRIDSVTKTMTAIAVLQLWERGLVDLDAPANDYLRAFRLIPARPGFRPATVRHLLTHTAGVRAVRGPSDLLRPHLGWSVPAGARLPRLADYYGAGVRIDVEPGTKWAYSNPGFATLGQVVEDVSGVPLDRYLREYLFRPVGLASSDLTRSQRVASRLSTGYQLHGRGLRAVRDREMVIAGAGSVYSTAADMARYVGVLLAGGAGADGPVLSPASLAMMFEPHYQPDPRIPGMGLGFFRGDADGHRTVGHDGIWAGHHASMVLAPADGVGVVCLTNTGPFGPFAAAGPVAAAVLRSVLGLGADAPRSDLPEQPWIWRELCGWYTLGPGLLTDPQPRMLGPIEVVVRGGQLVIRGQLPVPAMRDGLRLHPDGADPAAFRVVLPGFGAGTSAVVFSRDAAGKVAALHLGYLPLTFRKRTGIANPRPWAAGALTAGAAALLVARRHHAGTTS
jgi:CubicO group peptidase (beta-lactamase class C family)